MLTLVRHVHLMNRNKDLWALIHKKESELHMKVHYYNIIIIIVQCESNILITIGYVKIPKARGGVRKGWVRMYVVVCDFKLFLYDIMNAGEIQSAGLNYSNLSNIDPSYSTLINTPSVSANTIIDMRFAISIILYYIIITLSCIHHRDEHFSVNDVTESDVIHASPRDIPCIFRITTSMIGDPKEGWLLVLFCFFFLC